MAELRRALSTVLEQNALALELQERAHRVWVAQIPSVELLRHAGFVLAVHADLPAETVRTRYPAQVKVGPVERLAELVHLQSAGHRACAACRSRRGRFRITRAITTSNSMPAANSGSNWSNPAASRLHVAGDLPGLTMECWAIRG